MLNLWDLKYIKVNDNNSQSVCNFTESKTRKLFFISFKNNSQIMVYNFEDNCISGNLLKSRSITRTFRKCNRFKHNDL